MVSKIFISKTLDDAAISSNRKMAILSLAKPLSLLCVADVVLTWMALFVLAMVAAMPAEGSTVDLNLLALSGGGFMWALAFGIYCSVATKGDARYRNRVERMATQRGHTMMFVSFMGFGPAAEYARLETKAGSLPNIARALVRHCFGFGAILLAVRYFAVEWYIGLDALGTAQSAIVTGSAIVSLVTLAGTFVAVVGERDAKGARLAMCC